MEPICAEPHSQPAHPQPFPTHCGSFLASFSFPLTRFSHFRQTLSARSVSQLLFPSMPSALVFLAFALAVSDPQMPVQSVCPQFSHILTGLWWPTSSFPTQLCLCPCRRSLWFGSLGRQQEASVGYMPTLQHCHRLLFLMSLVILCFHVTWGIGPVSY